MRLFEAPSQLLNSDAMAQVMRVTPVGFPESVIVQRIFSNQPLAAECTNVRCGPSAKRGHETLISW